MKLISFGASKPIKTQDSNFNQVENLKVFMPSLVGAGTIIQSVQDKIDLNSTVKKTLNKTPDFLQEIASKNKQIFSKCMAGLGVAVGLFAFMDYLGLKTKENQAKLNND